MDYTELTQSNKIFLTHLFLKDHFDADSTITCFFYGTMQPILLTSARKTLGVLQEDKLVI